MHNSNNEQAQPEIGSAETAKRSWAKPLITEVAVKDLTEAFAGSGPDGVPSFYNS